MGVDIDQAQMDVGDAGGVGRGLRLFHQARALEIGGENEIDQGSGTAGRLLLDAAKAHLARIGDRAGLGRELARNHAKQRRLAGAVAADEADPRVIGKRGGRLVEKNPRPQPQHDVVDMEHASLSLGLRCIARESDLASMALLKLVEVVRP